MKFWQALAFCDMEQLPAVAQKAEQVGFHGLLLSDHLVVTKEQYDDYLYTEDSQVLWTPETHWPDPWVQIGALAQITSTIQFCTSVYVLPMRDAFSAAKAIGTASIISKGRVSLGVGSGWQSTEFDLVGKDFKSRGRHLDEQLVVMKKLWTDGFVEHHGEFYDFAPLQMSPAPKVPPPILVGGHSPVAFRRAAQHDGWIGMVYPFEAIPPLLQQLQDARVAAGTRDRPFEIILGCLDLDREKLTKLEMLGVTGILKDAWLKDGRAAPSTLEYKCEEMEAYAERFF